MTAMQFRMNPTPSTAGYPKNPRSCLDNNLGSSLNQGPFCRVFHEGAVLCWGPKQGP